MVYDYENRILTIEKEDVSDYFTFRECRQTHNSEFESAKEIILPDNIDELYDMCFEECSNLERITIPETVKRIGYDAFRNCENLRRITIPEGVLTIEDFTFQDCLKLGDVKLPKSLKTIKEGAFDGCASLERVVLPDGLEKLDRFVFSNCTNLKEMHLPSKITEISNCLFKECVSLETVTSSSKIRAVYGNAFYCCRKFQDLKIDDYATVYSSAFRGCNPHTKVYQYGMVFPAWLYKDNKVTYFMEKPSYERLLNIPSMTNKIILSVMFLERFEDDKRFKTYVKRNLSKVIDYIASSENVEMLDILISNDVISKKTIDKCLECIEKNDFHEAFIMLARYKEEIGGYKKTNQDRFEL